MTLIRHGTIYTGGAVIPDGVVRVVGDTITYAGDAGAESDSRLHRDPGEEEIDARGLLLIPGLIDMQCNGIAGHDALAGTEAAILGLSAVLPRHGCTAVLPTLITAGHQDQARALEAVAVGQQHAQGAAILGTHMEGPWLSAAHAGAHPVQHVRRFDREEYRALRQAARGTLRLVTLAPETEGGADAVTALVADGVLVSLGHSGVSYEGAVSAVAEGARMATHLFNAMSPLHHRAPGLAGAALTVPALTPGIIPDGHHVHPAILRLAVAARSGRDIVAVTDSVPAAGLAPGRYTWRERAVLWDGETVRLEQGGGLAGSGLTPIEALRRLMRFTGLSLAEALPAMTSTPARLLGEDGRRGAIAPGYRGDIVLLTGDLQVHSTLVGGQVVFRA